MPLKADTAWGVGGPGAPRGFGDMQKPQNTYTGRRGRSAGTDFTIPVLGVGHRVLCRLQPGSGGQGRGRCTWVTQTGTCILAPHPGDGVRTLYSSEPTLSLSDDGVITTERVAGRTK